jgi:phosphatidate cytidylyltransferase
VLSSLNKRIITSIILLLLVTLMFFYNYIYISVIIIASVIIWVEFNNLIFRIFKEKSIRILCGLLGLSYITFFVLIMIVDMFMNLNNDKNLILFFLIICIATDLGGFIFGKIFKGKKLSKISPNKTISGSIGSFFLSICAMFIYPILVNVNITILIISITILVSLASQIGDLAISFLKRKAKVKDTSDLLPGHGGFLDRVDGILLGVPLGIFMMTYLF